MNIQKTNNMNRILYSNYRSHHSTTAKIQKTENTFANQMFESKNYLTIIDEFYHSLRQKRDKKRQNELFHKYPINQMVDLIVDLVKSYNDHYINLLNHDHEFNANTHIKLKDELKKFEFKSNWHSYKWAQFNKGQLNTFERKIKRILYLCRFYL